MQGSEAAAALRAHLDRAGSLDTRVTALRAEIAAAADEARRERASAAVALAACYLPALDAPGLERARRLTGFTGFERNDPLRALPKEAERLRRRIAQILADPRYVQRQLLVGPMGSLTLARQEAEGFLAEWETACARFERLDRFTELVDTGYDTPAFSVAWTQALYWKLWAAGDAVCAALGLADFGDDVLPAFRVVEAERRKWRGEVAKARQAVDDVHEVVREHDESVGRLANLPRIFLDEAQSALGSFLEGVDHPLLAEWASADPASDPAIPLHLKRVAGLSAKIESLSAVDTELVGEAASAIGAQRSKWSRKLPKLEGKKRWVDVGAAAADPDAAGRLDKVDQRLGAVERTVRRIRKYDRYDAFSLDNPPELWWVEFTGSPPPSRMRLRSWYDRNPSVVVVREESHSAAVGAAVTGSDADTGLGHLS